ncbi:hypothetical protein [Haloplanus aerogenes]|uniref:Uncharacterized protein n=1 Tax=Haloplanus aerogenes TaxID=660522 RepID=A0A3M0DWU9_9EURY|nr:hypothetical protein [Haloplanus aerogenes]RMB25377.1 hypothetical protein ATH50_0465 [Haloplanus aerogenes]
MGDADAGEDVDSGVPDGDDTADAGAGGDDPSPRLGSRILVTWIELTVVGITGGLVGGTLGGPPGFVVYLFTTLLTVAILFYNVNDLIAWWVQAAA